MGGPDMAPHSPQRSARPGLAGARLGTVTLSYNFLGRRRFGAVDWRPGEIDR